MIQRYRMVDYDPITFATKISKAIAEDCEDGKWCLSQDVLVLEAKIKSYMNDAKINCKQWEELKKYNIEIGARFAKATKAIVNLEKDNKEYHQEVKRLRKILKNVDRDNVGLCPGCREAINKALTIENKESQ